MPIVVAEGRIKPSDLGPDEHLARRILIRARAIQPSLPSFGGGSEERADALAVLVGVYRRGAGAGSGAVASQSRNGTSINFRDVKSLFTTEDITSLQSLDEATAIANLVPGLPRGSFPTDRPLARVFPEGEYT